MINLNKINKLHPVPNWIYNSQTNDNNNHTKETPERPKIESKDQFRVKILSGNDDSLIQVKIVYERAENVNKCDVNDIRKHLEKGQTLLTSYFQPIKRTNDLSPLERRPNSIEINDPGNLIIKCNNNQKWNFKRSKRICRKYARLNICKYSVRKRTGIFLVQFAQKSRKEFSSHRWYWFRKNSKVSFIHRCLITYHRFIVEYVNQLNKPQSERKTTNMTTEALVTNRRIQKMLNDNIGTPVKETNDENILHTGQQQIDVGTKRLQAKNQRISENNRLLLTENSHETSEKDFCKFITKKSLI